MRKYSADLRSKQNRTQDLSWAKHKPMNVRLRTARPRGLHNVCHIIHAADEGYPLKNRTDDDKKYNTHRYP